MKTRFILALLFACPFFSVAQKKPGILQNPILQGYYADPSIVRTDSSCFLYATIDPWGADRLAVFETADFLRFEPRQINWPTKAACSSPTSGGAMVWAPSVVQAPDGLFYMYVSVGSEIWAGVSPHPLGPWKNAKSGNEPFIPGDLYPGYHMIDAECFIDEDGQAYLYWGSGLNWVNGKCFAAKLRPDMVSFYDPPKDITPPDYFEAPFMMKRRGVYYLMYSEGKAIDSTYNIRYATGPSPFGPWTAGKNSPILRTDSSKKTFGPGHHAVFQAGGQSYILYHRIHPQEKEFVLRELCLGRLEFDKRGNIRKVRLGGVPVPGKD